MIGKHPVVVLCFSITFVLTYTLQITVYLWNDLQLYLDHLPQLAICYCADHNSTTLPFSPWYRCQCRVPFVESLQVVFTTSPNDTENTSQTFKEYGLEYQGDVKVVILEPPKSDEEVKNSWSYDETKKVSCTFIIQTHPELSAMIVIFIMHFH